jgi:hypothetical protein
MGFLRSPRLTTYVSHRPRSRASDGSFAKRPFRFLKLQGSPAALTLTLSHPISHLLLASQCHTAASPASPAASTAAPPWSPPPPAHRPLPRIYLPQRWLSGAPSPGGSPSSPFLAAAVPQLCPPRPQVRRPNPALRGAAAAGSVDGRGCSGAPPSPVSAAALPPPPYSYLPHYLWWLSPSASDPGARSGAPGSGGGWTPPSWRPPSNPDRASTSCGLGRGGRDPQWAGGGGG